MILSEIFCANLGGSATMCGDPPNIIIGTSLGYSFTDFVTNTGVIAAISLVAKGESFVVVGRCSESVLKDYPELISIFVLGEEEKKVQRIMGLYQMSESHAKKLINKKDMKRKRYHNNFCEGKWGDSRNYDISINSSKLGIDETVELLVE